jgi:hypothetical protein
MRLAEKLDSKGFNIKSGVTIEVARQTDTLNTGWNLTDSAEDGSPTNLFHLGT